MPKKRVIVLLKVFHLHSKYPHFNSAYLLRVPFSSCTAASQNAEWDLNKIEITFDGTFAG